jgi:DNA-binding transcriptional ArsR family regulator
MATHKTEEFNSGDQQISQVAKAMSHPARIAILRLLASGEQMTCGDIVKVLPLAQATVSHHLKELTETKLINLIHEGKKSLYAVNWETWNNCTQEFTFLLGLLNKKG